MCGKTGRSAVSAQALMVPYGGTAGACPLRQRLARRGLVAQHFVVSHCRCLAVAWGRWIGGAIGGESMNQKWHRRAEDFKLFGEALQPLFLTLSAIGAVSTFFVAEVDRAEGREQEAKDRTFEARKPYLAKQLDLYSETTGVVGLLLATNPTKGDDYGEVLKRWTKLYQSELPLVADQHCVESELVAVDKAAWDYYQPASFGKEKGKIADERKAAKVVLESKACDLAFAMQAAVSKAWNTSRQKAGNSGAPSPACPPRPGTFQCPEVHQKEGL